MKPLCIVMAFVFAAMPASASAGSIFLNGVDITNVRNQTFKNATVSIDNDGNIRISAPGYKVEVLDSGGSVGGTVQTAAGSDVEKGGTNPSLSQKYYLVTQPSINGRAQYDFTLLVNGVPRKTIKAGAPQLIMEISAWLKRGENDIELRATKNLINGRVSVSQNDEARLLLGVGHVENKTVRIDSVKASIKVNASSSSNVVKHLVLIAK